MFQRRLLALVLAASGSALLASPSLGWASHYGDEPLWGNAGPYRLELKISDPQKMTTRQHVGGEVMLGGKMATCHMGKYSTGMMSTAENTCNWHMEVHVSRRGKVVSNARVGISMFSPRRHKTITVPIMKMMDGTGTKDIHYGNNVYVPAGLYKTTVSVNGFKIVFATAMVPM